MISDYNSSQKNENVINTGQDHPDHQLSFLSAFPKPINSVSYSRLATSLASKNDQCQNLEKMLLQQGQIQVENIKNGRPVETQLDIPKNDNCSACRILTQTWQRYFDHLSAVDVYIRTKQLPPIPVKTRNCSSCQDIQNKYGRYAQKQRDVIHCLEQQKGDCPTLSVPRDKYNNLCDNCEQTYNQWALYSFALRDIIAYLRDNFSQIKSASVLG